MFQFAGFASPTYGFSGRYRRSGGLPHSEIHGSMPARGSPWLIATCCVLHRLSVPRHPPDALHTLVLTAFTRRVSRLSILRTPRAGANPHIGDLREDASHKTQPYEPPKQQLRHRRSRCHRRITLSGHPLVTYPLHNVNRSRIGAHRARKHKPLPSRDASRNRLPGA